VAGELVQRFSAELLRRGERAATNFIAGLPGRHASMQIYPAKEYRTLSVPMDSMSGKIDVLGQIGKRQDNGAGSAVATIRDNFQVPSTAASAYTATFTLDTGSYVCNLVVRELDTGRMYGETINFEVQ
jgi:hypothetical protein